MEFEPITTARAYERIVEQIEQAVLSGRLPPGHRLPGERELMAQFGVGRSTVREALRVLQANDVIRSRQGDPRGPEVLGASPSTLYKSMHRLARTEGLGLADLLQFRMLLEGSAYRLAAALRTEEHLARMSEALQAMRGERDYHAFSRADVAFHDAVAQATGNPLIIMCAEVVRGVVLEQIEGKLATAADRRALMRGSLAHHAEVLEAVREGDAERASRLATHTLHDYYAGYLPSGERVRLDPLLD